MQIILVIHIVFIYNKFVLSMSDRDNRVLVYGTYYNVTKVSNNGLKNWYDSLPLKKDLISGSTSVNGDTKITVTNFNIPNQILVYKNGKEKKILKDDNKYAEILKLSDNRIGIKIDRLKLVIPKESIEKLKKTETFIEFVYSEQQKKIGNLEQKYIELIFPLTGDYIGYCLFEQGNNNDYSGPISNLGSPDSLLNLLK